MCGRVPWHAAWAPGDCGFKVCVLVTRTLINLVVISKALGCWQVRLAVHI